MLYVAGLLSIFGCGGDDNPTPPDPTPDISGVWNGTETVVQRGGTQCNPAVETGTRTGDIFNVTQDGGRIVITQLVNCIICRYTGSISTSGAFDVRGTIPPAGTLLVQGQVSGNGMTATKRPIGIDCNQTAEYQLTRRE